MKIPGWSLAVARYERAAKERQAKLESLQARLESLRVNRPVSSSMLNSAQTWSSFVTRDWALTYEGALTYLPPRYLPLRTPRTPISEDQSTRPIENGFAPPEEAPPEETPTPPPVVQLKTRRMISG